VTYNLLLSQKKQKLAKDEEKKQKRLERQEKKKKKAEKEKKAEAASAGSSASVPVNDDITNNKSTSHPLSLSESVRSPFVSAVFN
jgi:hypothetical protein